MRSRKLLALLFCLITFPAIAGYMTLLGAGVGSIAPVVSWVSTTDAFPSSSLTFSRTSNATMFDSTGKLTYAPNNLLLQSNTFSNAAWTKVSATITTGVLDRSGGTSASTLTATGAFANLYAFATTSSSHNVIQSIWIRRRTGTGKIWMKIASSGALFEITGQVTSGWTQVSISGAANASSTPNFLQLDTSGDAVDISEAGVSAVTYETTPRTADQVITTSSAYYGPRIDYDPNTLAVKGLLIEEARTNLVPQSADVSNAAWTKGNVTATVNATTAPDGTATAASVMEAATTSAHYVFNASAITVVGASQYTGSTFLKANGRSWVIVALEMGGNSYGKYVDLSTGTIGSTYILAPDAFSITNCGNGWYRVSMSKAAPSGGASGFITTYGTTADLASNSYLGDITKGYYRWGSQFELGSFATSYIPTAAASVTRAADVVQFTGAALTALQGSAATFVGQTIGLPFNPAANSALVAATAGNSVIAYVTNSNAVGVAAAATYNGAVALIVGTPNYATAMRIGSAFSGSGRSLVVNGGSVATDANTIGSRPAVYLGGTGTSLHLNGWMQSFAVYNQRLPDATLQTKSVVGASYAANDNGVRFAFANDNLPVHWRVAL